MSQQSKHSPLPEPHLFLDRDGTLIMEENYLSDPARVTLADGAVEGLHLFLSAGYRLVVVSNQSGVGRGFITEADVASINRRISELLLVQGLTISSWHHCPHRPEEGCICRKPAPGLLQQASALHLVDWHRSWLVGDKPSDVQAGLSFGMRTALVTTGYGSHHVAWAQSLGVPVVSSLKEMAYRFVRRYN